jgi:hypothetical protein
MRESKIKGKVFVYDSRTGKMVEKKTRESLSWYCATGRFVYGPYASEEEAWEGTRCIQTLSKEPWRVYRR